MLREHSRRHSGVFKTHEHEPLGNLFKIEDAKCAKFNFNSCKRWKTPARNSCLYTKWSAANIRLANPLINLLELHSLSLLILLDFWDYSYMLYPMLLLIGNNLCNKSFSWNLHWSILTSMDWIHILTPSSDCLQCSFCWGYDMGLQFWAI